MKPGELLALGVDWGWRSGVEQQGFHLGGIQGPRGTYAFNKQRVGGRRDKLLHSHLLSFLLWRCCCDFAIFLSPPDMGVFRFVCLAEDRLSPFPHLQWLTQSRAYNGCQQRFDEWINNRVEKRFFCCNDEAKSKRSSDGIPLRHCGWLSDFKP